jgi:hypothetical protein
LGDTQGSVGSDRVFLFLFNTTQLEECCLDVDGYLKLIKAIWRKFRNVNLKFLEELVVFMTHMALRNLSGSREESWKQARISSWRLSRKRFIKMR